jgi:hypothetical protein
MAKTKKSAASPKKGRFAKKAPPPPAAGLQAPTGAWSADLLLSALRRGSDQDKVAILKKAGILDAEGNFTKTYENWGKKVTRTPDAEVSA